MAKHKARSYRALLNVKVEFLICLVWRSVILDLLSLAPQDFVDLYIARS